MSKILFFSINDGVNGIELWRTDGTAAGTQMVKDIRPSDPDAWTNSSYASWIAPVGGGRVVFQATDRNLGGRELWISDGTEAGTALLKEIDPSGNSYPSFMTPLGDGRVVFNAERFGVDGEELWITDGTTAGTTLLKDINPNNDDWQNQSSDPRSFKQLDSGRVIFTADDGSHGTELWVTDGTASGTMLLADITPGADSSSFYAHYGTFYFDLPDGSVVFQAWSDTYGETHWKTDGTPEGTIQLGPEYAGLKSLLPDGRLQVSLSDGETFFTDGTEDGTTLRGTPENAEPGDTDPVYFELNLGEGPFPGNEPPNASDRHTQILDDGQLLYRAETFEIKPLLWNDVFYAVRWELGEQLWVTDGTEAGSRLVERFNTGDARPDESTLPPDYDEPLPPRPDSDPQDFFFLPDGRVVLVADDGAQKNLYITDGTADGTNLLAGGITHVGSASFMPWSPDVWLFEAEGANPGVWKTDGSAGGTEMLLADGSFSASAFSDAIDLGNGKWLFDTWVGGSWPDGNLETWLTDATPGGTKKIADGSIGQFDQYAFGHNTIYQPFTSLGDGRYITTRDTSGEGLYDPWLLDSDTGTLELISDIYPPDAYSGPFSYPVAIYPPGQIPVPISTLFEEKVSLGETPASFDLDDYFEDPAGTTLNYTVSGTPAEITVDPVENVLEATAAAQPGSYTVDVTASNSLGGETTDSFDWTVVDTGILKIATSDDWGRETPGGPILSTPGSVVTIGRKDDTEALFRVVPTTPDAPAASIENGRITVLGNVFSEQMTTAKPLMQGGFTIDMETAAVSGFTDSDITTDYRLVADLIDLQFDNVTIETDKITFDTDLVFGDSAGGGPAYSALSTTGAPVSVDFGASGLEFGIAGGAERWSPEPVEFDLGGGSSINIGFSDLGIDYESATDTVYLSGKATVGWGGAIENGFDFLDNDSEQSLVIDLAGDALAGNYFQRGDKYLKITNGAEGWDWDVVGAITYEDKYEGPVPSNGLLVKELGVSFDTVQDTYSGNFKANIPLFFGLDIAAALGFVNTTELALDNISFGIDGLNYPVGTTGLFVQGGSFGLENLAASDPDAGWTYNADITGTFGPDNDLVSSPLHGKIAGTVKETLQQETIGYILTGSIELDSKVGYFLPDIVSDLATPLIDYFGVAPEDVTEFEMLTATSSTQLDFTKDLVQLDATLSLLNGVVNGTANLLDAPFGSEQDVRKLTGSVAATLTIPEDFPLVGGMTRSGNARVEYSSDGDFSNDVAAFWGSISLPFGYVRQVGAELTFDGDYQFLGRKDIAKISSWPLNDTSDLVILSARWEIAADGVAIELIAPDGSVLTEADIAAREDIALVNDLNTQNGRHVALQNPETGIWDLRVADSSGLGVVRYEASEILESAVAPIESLTHDLDAHQAEIVINLDAGDAETVDIVIFAAPDTGQVTGIELDTITMNAGDPDVTHVIDYDALGPGDWHIYTRTEADGLAPGIDMYSAPVTIAGAADLKTGVQQAQHTPSGQQIITIEVSNDGDRPSQAGSLTIDAPAGMLNASPIPEHDAIPLEESQSQLELPPLAPGETFTVHISLPAGSEDLADTIFVEAWAPGIDADRTDNALGQGLLTDANHLPAGVVNLTGPVELGTTVGVDLSGLIEPDGYDPATVAYQWLLDGAEIAGATGATHDVVENEVGKHISVEISYTDDDGADETFLSSIVRAAGIPQNLIGTPAPDALLGGDGHDTIEGLEDNDTLTGNAGDDLLDGGSGVDTGIYSGPQSSYTLTLSPSATTITDRRPDGDGTDDLIDMELLDFESGVFDPFDLTVFGGPTTLSQEDFESFIELYIAYFNRAPDAIGLNFWGTAFANGTSLEEMAALFAPQDETLETYPEGTSNEDFATSVYNNVLGRDPDIEGFNFWVGQLDDGNFSRDQFILEVLKGAKAGWADDATQEFIDQKLADRAYLENKVDIGAYFAVHKGMSDVDNAVAAMELFGDQDTSNINDAVAAIDSYYADAIDPTQGEFLMPLVGVLDNSFAMA